ncbi:MAG: sugar ABC transporter permease [Mariniphaga sp.]
MGLGQFYNGAVLKGLLFLLIELALIFNVGQIVTSLEGPLPPDAPALSVWDYTNFPNALATVKGLFTLGEKEQTSDGFDVIQGDHSVFLLVNGLVLLLVLGVFALLYVVNIRSARRCAQEREKGKPVSVRRMLNDNFFPLSLTPGFLAILFFTLLPMIVTICVAFTNYRAPDHLPPRNLVQWVGFQNFSDLFSASIWGETMATVGVWNIIWTVSITFLNFAAGLGLALLTAHKKIRFRGLWRVIFILPYAIPSFISLLVMRVLFNGAGAMNNLLSDWGLDKVPFLTDSLIAKFVILGVAVWVSAPYFMILCSSAMTNISADLYEAADIDGASPWLQFRQITLPLVLTQLMPAVMLTFSMNFNNFGAIYLLTDGRPDNSSLSYAGDTDIFISWVYKLTLNNQQFAMAAAITILLFAFVATICIFYFTRTKSFQEGSALS